MKFSRKEVAAIERKETGRTQGTPPAESLALEGKASRALPIEQHFTSSRTVRDIILGMADGLTVPFALAAGLSGAVDTNTIVVIAGLAEIAAGSVAMGLGGYLAAKSELDHYQRESQREQQEIDRVPEAEAREVSHILRSYGLNAQEAAIIVAALRRRPQAWLDFMMRFELGLEAPDPKRAITSGLFIGLSYVVGGFIPLTPYIVLQQPSSSLVLSIIVTLAALAILGYLKGRLTSTKALTSAFQTLLIGGVAAGVAYTIARLIS